MSILQELTKLRDRAWVTAGARYNAARRLRLRARLSLFTISLVSAIGVAIPLLLATDGPRLNSSVVSAYAALLSLFILVIAIIESASTHDARADALYRCAERLNSFQLKLNAVLADDSQCTIATLSDMTKEYGNILESCSINHEVVDYELVVVTHPRDFDAARARFRKQIVLLQYYLISTWWLAVLLAGVIAGFVIVLRVPNV